MICYSSKDSSGLVNLQRENWVIYNGNNNYHWREKEVTSNISNNDSFYEKIHCKRHSKQHSHHFSIFMGYTFNMQEQMFLVALQIIKPPVIRIIFRVQLFYIWFDVQQGGVVEYI
jgi:hypothetical protein